MSSMLSHPIERFEIQAGDPMELYIIGEFRPRRGNEAAVEAAIRKVVPPTRVESACLGINAFRSNRDAALFFIHSRWRDEAAFEVHARLPHTVEFLVTVEPLLTHEVEVARVTRII
jgi:quinol monooxygenase YgiN